MDSEAFCGEEARRGFYIFRAVSINFSNHARAKPPFRSTVPENPCRYVSCDSPRTRGSSLSLSLALSFSFFRVRGEVASAVDTAVSQPFRGYVTLKKLFGVNTPRYSDTCSTPWIRPFPRRSAAALHPAVTRRQPSLPPSPPRAQAMTPLLSLPFPPTVSLAYSKCSFYSRRGF